jgi:prevent-host-death family protein
MERVGLREANIHFARYMKLVKNGEKILLTDRGEPFAVIKPLKKEKNPVEERLQLLEDQGILSRGRKKKLPLRDPVTLEGAPTAEMLAKEREEGR